jgi:double-stranded uracil-DNA glycosylase
MSMSLLYSFPPIADANARILILGSMPGQASLDANQYYAHKRNLFWPIMGELLGFDPTLSYIEKTECLKTSGVAVWDVLQSCQREGSLDVCIKNETPNDFGTFLNSHPQINTIFFNGDKAATSFKKYVLTELQQTHCHLIRLPSTSPANASQTVAMKRQAWQQVYTALFPE